MNGLEKGEEKNKTKVNKSEIKKQIVEAVKKGKTEKVVKLRNVLLNG